MASDLIINGEPKFKLEFFDVPSWNAELSKNFRDRIKDKSPWRKEGAMLAHRFIFNAELEYKKFCVQFSVPYTKKSFKYVIYRGLLVIEVQPGTEGEMDVFNKNIKHITDGFTDAKVWRDDNYKVVPLVLFYCIKKDPNPQYKQMRRKVAMTRTIISVHELRSFIINGQSQLLPEINYGD